MTDPDDTLTAVFGGDLDGQTVTALAGYLADGGTLVFNTGAPSARAGSTGPWPARPGIVVNVGPPVPGMPGTLVNLGGGVTRTARILTAAAEALRACGHAPGPAAAQPAGDATSWTFDDQGVPSHGRVRVRVGAGGYVPAGVTHAGGRWAPVYEVPLVPAAAAASEAVLSLPPRCRRVHVLLDPGPQNTRPSRSLGMRRTRRPDLPGNHTHPPQAGHGVTAARARAYDGHRHGLCRTLVI